MKESLRLRLFLFSGCLAVLLAGCQNAVDTIGNTPPDNQPAPVTVSRFSADQFLAGRIKVLQTIVDDTPGGMLKMQMTLQSMRYGPFAQFWSWFTSDYPYRLEYRITWLDEKGIAVPVAATRKWLPVDVYPGEIFQISGTAPTAGCRDFRLSLRERD